MSENCAEDTRQWVRELFPDHIATWKSKIGDAQGHVYPEELALVEGAVPVRLREFIAGRCCARKAMHRFGYGRFALLSRKDRAPIWPTGLVGSIAHTDEYSGAAVGLEKETFSIGLDIEKLGRVTEDLYSSLFVERELDWLDNRGRYEKGLFATLIFSAKECFFKFQYPITHRLLGFKEVRVSIDPARQRFEIHTLVSLEDALAGRLVFPGAYSVEMNTVFTGIFGK
jgi:4'-phosphopantetheinyl transferase EntD